MNIFDSLEISLPVVGSSSVKEVGRYICKLVAEAVKLVTDRDDTGNNPNLKERTDEFTPPWNDVTPQMFCQFKTEDGSTISDRFQLRGYEHFDKDAPPTKEQKEAWAEAFAKKGLIVARNAKKQLMFKAEPYRGSTYVCAIMEDDTTHRIPNADNTNKSLMRLSGMFHNAGVKITSNVVTEWIPQIQASTELKAFPIILTDKVFEGERRSTSKLFSIQYGEKKEDVTKKTVANANLI